MLRISRILVPIDFADASLEALEQAIFMASALNAEIVLLNVLPPERSPELSDGAFSEENLAEQNLRAMFEDRLNLFCAPVPGISARSPIVLIHRGDPVEEVIAVASAMGVDLIVMGTHGRTGIRRVLLGSVTEAVLRRANCPVLTVRAFSREPVLV